MNELPPFSDPFWDEDNFPIAVEFNLFGVDGYEMQEWFAKNLTLGNWRMRFTSDSQPASPNGAVLFKSNQDAMLFKLTFGGEA